MKINKKELLKSLKYELEINANDYPNVYDVYNETNTFYVDENGLIKKCKKISYKKLVSIIIKELNENFENYVYELNDEIIEPIDFYEIFDFDLIEEFAKKTLLQIKDK